MDIVHGCCAGLDVHKKTVVACVRRLAADGQVHEQVKTFGTMTGDLLALGDWLEAQGATTAAMESTGVYWKPIYHLLEDRFALLLVNAQHIKRVPGRKTDVKDAQWIAQLLQYGLLSPSFVPPPSIRELRDLTRQRTQSIRERARVINRIQKVLEDANIKLSSVASDVMGATGKAILAAMVRGVEDPVLLADQARGSLRGKKPQLQTALEGRVTAHHRFLLETLLSEIRFHDEMIARYTTRIEETTSPFEKETARLTTIPGMGRQAAEVLTAEIGTDMSRFPTAGHLSSWAGMCPSNDESAGKRRNSRTTKGSRWLRTTLVQVAWSAIRTKKTIFGFLYKKWVRRLGKKKGLIAVAHKILVIAYHLLKTESDYVERCTPEPTS